VEMLLELVFESPDDLPVEVAEEVREEDDGERVSGVSAMGLGGGGLQAGCHGTRVCQTGPGGETENLPGGDPPDLLFQEGVDLLEFDPVADVAVHVVADDHSGDFHVIDRLLHGAQPDRERLDGQGA
jgi:hypothetical protein